MALGAGALLAPHAAAADSQGPGYLIPDSSGHAGASHIGAYGTVVPGALAYCADPNRRGPQASGGYGPVRDFASWASATGKSATRAQVSQAAYILSRYGRTTSDARAAAVDADIYTLLNAGSPYALPSGPRAVQRLAYPQVSPQAKADAAAYLTEAARYAGPYKVSLRPLSPLKPGVTTVIQIAVTSAAGYKVPGVPLIVKAQDGSKAYAGTEPTNAEGIAYAHVTAAKGDHVTLTAQATDLPSSTLRAVLPHSSGAQRMVIAGGTASAAARLTMTATEEVGHIRVLKTAGDTGKPLAGVEFAVQNKEGKTVTSGTTNAAGVWQTGGLPAGEYTVHEVAAAEGYQLASDQHVVVTDGKTAAVAVRDARIPTPVAPKPRLVMLKVLPQTGA